MELFRLPSVRRIFLRASVYKASPGACFARATGRRITKWWHILVQCLDDVVILIVLTVVVDNDHVAEDLKLSDLRNKIVNI